MKKTLVCFALTLAMAHNLVAQQKRDPQPPGLLGLSGGTVQIQQGTLSQQLGVRLSPSTHGLRVDSAAPAGSKADQIGLEVGDVIAFANRMRMNSAAQLDSMIASGARVQLSIRDVRSGNYLTRSVPMAGPRPFPPQPAPRPNMQTQVKISNMTGFDITLQARAGLGPMPINYLVAAHQNRNLSIPLGRSLTVRINGMHMNVGQVQAGMSVRVFRKFDGSYGLRTSWGNPAPAPMPQPNNSWSQRLAAQLGLMVSDMSFGNNTRIYVQQVNPGSRGQRIGLRAGDSIVGMQAVSNPPSSSNPNPTGSYLTGLKIKRGGFEYQLSVGQIFIP